MVETFGLSRLVQQIALKSRGAYASTLNFYLLRIFLTADVALKAVARKHYMLRKHVNINSIIA